MTVRGQTVSVLLPTYERLDAVRETLDALAAVDYPADAWEAVVVDDGSAPATVTAVRLQLQDLRIRTRLLEQSRRGPAAARNFAARNATGEILVFIDNDIIVRRDFLLRHVTALGRNPGCWIVGRIVHPDALRVTPFGRYRDARWEEFHLAFGGHGLVETPGMSAANLAIPAADFHRLGGFDEGFDIASCEDWELGLRARAEGIRILYDPDNVVVHNDWAVTLLQFCERQRLYSVSDVLLWTKYGNASPRAGVVQANAPLCWAHDQMWASSKKIVKRLLITRLGTALVRGMCGVLEAVIPDSRLLRRGYDLAVAIAIFRGVRDGFRRYGADGLTASLHRPAPRAVSDAPR